ncbi:hypothetical protein JTF06_04635 [Desemzia sp. RIT804]|uniref:hypothetical protein n=1 Tax=Desemzia sp. RIT 804 TaxID=2810209 RepID=UPI00194DCAFB|nr:hypothetical protein [Desemzia sp. RIT 804]MBM6614008.1 hypothetical protein [Desemzia sp. RIT 804]MBM6614091.1 hypothetical protein [Desemzia sp. RIT 804]MBM6614174.1 hypothetical protein [Desemzia sp. RIT 804]
MKRAKNQKKLQAQNQNQLKKNSCLYLHDDYTLIEVNGGDLSDYRQANVVVDIEIVIKNIGLIRMNTVN